MNLIYEIYQKDFHDENAFNASHAQRHRDMIFQVPQC